LFHRAAGSNPEVNRHLSPGRRALACRQAIEGSRQADLGYDQRKGFRFDPVQGGASIPDRGDREPLFGKGLSNQARAPSSPSMTRISRCAGFIGNSLHGMRDCTEAILASSCCFGYLFRSTFEAHLVGLPANNISAAFIASWRGRSWSATGAESSKKDLRSP
jgi:hypothetical protein